MLTTILTRGLRACQHLLGRFALGLAVLAPLPLWLLFGWAVPEARALVVRFANAERARAMAYLGLPLGPELPPATERRFGDIRAITQDRSVRRALAVLPIALLGIPALLVGISAALAAPAAIIGIALWWIDPGQFTLLGVGVNSWFEAVTLGTGQFLVGVLLLGWVTPAIAKAHARLTSDVLAPRPDDLEAARLAARVEELTRTRAGAVDAHGAELRRIERDLHDGTQAQLVSLAMRIGIAKQTMLSDPDKAAALLDDARDGAEQAMTELRGVLRTMYPPILADRGLAGAVSALAARCPIQTQLRIGELGIVPAPVEAAAYFVVAESLTNVTKHAAAGHIDVQLERRGPELYLAITDDGIGGAAINTADDGTRGSGLNGMLHRVQAIDGHLELASPIGGPTTIEVILPCE
ncbi:histidine kinase [Kribbella sp. NBC_01245]|uniref:sensor histidine kinase n=1 Tax=Kribbella sp. NBC_01245 TaxID=2903578 RepID=UPI002E2B2C12|nr:histidine kinase [Kribbella sp. NBC_01245]